MTRRRALLAASWIALAAVAWGAVTVAWDRWIAATPLPRLGVPTSTEVLDRDGRLLRAFTVDDGLWRFDATPSDVDPTYLAMLLAYEDRRFYQHRGVDARALARAAWQAVVQRRWVSGGSTLTMQVARLLDGGGTGSWRGKLRQIRVALALERIWSKDEILTAYLRLAPMGGNVEGVRAGARTWLGHEPNRLTEAEAALLIALPQSPTRRAPDRARDEARAARDRILQRVADLGVIDGDAARAAATEALPDVRRSFPSLAPHLADRLRAAEQMTSRFVTTLDATTQAAVEDLARDALAALPPQVTVAVQVARIDDGSITASVGSAAYGDAARSGFVDVTQALRSPGSTLKPFVYALAFSDGILHPETLLDDRPTDFGGYAPQNFDGSFRGPVTAREALQASLNLPVVEVTEALGPARVLSALRSVGVTAVVPGDAPGLAIALGGVGVSLEGLVRAYGALARGGEPVPATRSPDASASSSSSTPTSATRTRFVTPQAAWMVADVLTGPDHPEVALKTGTSYGNRDAWALAFDGEHVVGVWVGRADGSAVPGLTGSNAAAPLALQVFGRLGEGPRPLPPAPPGTVVVASNEALPPAMRRFGVRAEATKDAPRLTFPPGGATVVALSGTVLARVEQGRAPFTWFVDDVPVVRGGDDRAVTLPVDAPGFASVSVVDAAGRAARVRFEVR